MADYDKVITLPNQNVRSKNHIGFKEFLAFVSGISSCKKPSYIKIDLEQARFAHSAGMAPMVALIRHLTELGWKFDIVLPADEYFNDYFEKAGWRDGVEGNQTYLSQHSRGITYIPLISYQTHEELNPIINSALEHFSKHQIYKKGVLDGIEWALNEVADNVLIHAESTRGWIQLAELPTKRLIEIVVIDCGRGILKSLQEGHPELNNHQDALRLAVERGVTRNSNIGQGNGLAGTLRIAMAANGFVNLYSGSASLRVMPQKNDLHSSKPVSSGPQFFLQDEPYFQGTVLTMTIPTNIDLDIAGALWGSAPTSYFEKDYLDETGTQILFKVFDEASGFGNRPSARPLRNSVENLMNQFPDKKISIDFDGVNLVSASFADEFIARLAKTVGVVTFFQKVKLVGMNDLVRRTMDAVIEQRLGQD